jgi:hypothetical protein
MERKKVILLMLVVLCSQLFVIQNTLPCTYNNQFAAIGDAKKDKTLDLKYKVIIEMIYLQDDTDVDAAGAAEVYFEILDDGFFSGYYGFGHGKDIRLDSNGFKQINQQIYSLTTSGTQLSKTLTITIYDQDSGTDATLGTVTYVIPDLDEGTYHQYETTSGNGNVKLWIITKYGAEPQYTTQFHSSFVLDTLYIIDDTDGGAGGEIMLEVIFNGLPLGLKYYPSSSSIWTIESGQFISLNINLTSDIIQESFVYFTSVKIMVWERDADFFGTEYFSSLGYLEFDFTSDFSVSSEQYTTTIPGSSGKATFWITASMTEIVEVEEFFIQPIDLMLFGIIFIGIVALVGVGIVVFLILRGRKGHENTQIQNRQIQYQSSVTTAKEEPYRSSSQKPNILFCPNCGMKLESPMRFCSSCGHKLED